MCECVKQMDELMVPHNGKVAMAFTLSRDVSKQGSRIIIATEKIDTKKRQRVPVLMANYCPFCGSEWPVES